MLYSARTASDAAGAGLLKRRSVPAPVFGNAITSRMEGALQRMDMRRSKPRILGQSRGRETCPMECRIRRFRSVEWGVRESAGHKRVARETKREQVRDDGEMPKVRGDG